METTSASVLERFIVFENGKTEEGTLGEAGIRKDETTIWQKIMNLIGWIELVVATSR